MKLYLKSINIQSFFCFSVDTVVWLRKIIMHLDTNHDFNKKCSGGNSLTMNIAQFMQVLFWCLVQ